MAKADYGTSAEPQEKPKDEVAVSTNDSDAVGEATRHDKLKSRIRAFLEMYDFPILIVIFIGIAKAYPPLGAHYLVPDITASWLAVALIFCKFVFNESVASVSAD